MWSLKTEIMLKFKRLFSVFFKEEEKTSKINNTATPMYMTKDDKDFTDPYSPITKHRK